jgi:hypothetical protein
MAANGCQWKNFDRWWGSANGRQWKKIPVTIKIRSH